MPEVAVSREETYSARPTIRIDEQQHLKVSELLVGMKMSESEAGLSSLELRLSNVASETTGEADLAFESEALLRLGSTIKVCAGDETAPQEIFRGIVTALEAEFPPHSPPELLVLAEDSLQRARMRRRTRVHDNVSIAELCEAVASDLGLLPVVIGMTDAVGTWVQLNESDLGFLRRVLHRHDADLQVVGGDLHVAPRGDVQRGALELELYSQLHGVRCVADLAHQVSEVTVSGWDALAGRRVSGTSTGANLGPGGGRTGKAIIEDALGPRSEHLGHLAVNSDAEARALADAAFDQRARRFVCVQGTAEGNPALRVGTHVRLTRVSPRFDNTYYVVSACHRFDVQRGYETDFEAQCATLGIA